MDPRMEPPIPPRTALQLSLTGALLQHLFSAMLYHQLIVADQFVYLANELVLDYLADDDSCD